MHVHLDSRISNFILTFPLRTGTPNDYAHRQFGPSVALTTKRPSTPSHPLTAFTLHQTIKSRGPRPTPGGHHHPNHNDGGKELEEVQFDYADVVVGTAEGGTSQEEPEAEEADYLGFLDDDIEKTPTQRSVRLILLH